MKIEIKEELNEEAFNFIIQNVETVSYMERITNLEKYYYEIEFDTNEINEDMWIFFYNLTRMI